MKKSKLLFMTSVGMAAVLIGCTPKPQGSYTYRGYASALASNWNPHSWETNADNSVLSYLSEGFVSLAPKDTAGGIYQWAYDMAEKVSDVTRTSPASLAKYHDMDAAGAAAFIEDLKEEDPGRLVYQIKLREGLKWQDGTVINADSFIESGRRLLDPAMKNYRANLFISGESALAGGMSYYYQGSNVYLDNSTTNNVPNTAFVASDEDIVLKDGVYVQKSNGLGVKIVLDRSLTYLGGNSLYDYVDAYGDEYFDVEVFEQLLEASDDDGDLELTPANLDLFKSFLDKSVPWGEDGSLWVVYAYAEQTFPAFSFDKVGLEKVDNLTFNYVMATPIDESQAMVSFSSTWLVHPAVYDQHKDATGALTVSKYGTKVENSMSYGPYKLASLQTDKQMVFERNPNWWGYKNEKGVISSTTNFEVNGKAVAQYQADSVIIDKLTDEAAKQKFLAGELSEYSPTAAELADYTLSDALYQVDETYTMSLFFNTNLDALKEMDSAKGNKNSVVLSDTSFRKAFSLAINRAEFVTKTEAYKPAFSLMNNLYYYDVWNDPTSSYRRSVPAMEAIVKLYGVEYGPGKAYATLEEAHASITGFNLTEAKALMKEAHTKLVEDKLYTTGQEIKIRVAYVNGPLQSSEEAQIALLNKYINAAIEGSGFGKVTLEGVGNLADRYGDVPRGEFAIGYGAWGGAAFYPFRNLQVYADPDQYSINEAANWDPKKETIEISFEHAGKTFKDTMTWQAWSGALTGGGKYATADNELKLKITAFLENAFLNKYYRIPLAGSTSSFLLGYQVSYITEEYNIMYDFGGFRLMKFNYSDADWAAFVSKSGGVIDYK